MADAPIDTREQEVAALARRAARAASARSAPGGPIAALTIEDIDESMMATLGRAFGRIEASSPAFGGAMLFRSAQAVPLVSLLPPERSEEIRSELLRVATGTRAQIDGLVGSPAGAFTDSIVATEAGAIIARLIEDDLLLVLVDGRGSDIAPVWAAAEAEVATIAAAAADLVKIELE